MEAMAADHETITFIDVSDGNAETSVRAIVRREPVDMLQIDSSTPGKATDVLFSKEDITDVVKGDKLNFKTDLSDADTNDHIITKILVETEGWWKIRLYR